MAAARSVRRSTALALLALLVLIATWQSVESVREALAAARRRAGRPDGAAQAIAQFAQLRDVIPADQPLAYWTRVGLNQDPDFQITGTYYLAQRGLAPRLLQQEQDQRWVLLIGVNEQTLPQHLQQRRARLVRTIGPITALVERQP